MVTTAAVIGAASAVGGVAVSADASRKALHAQQDAAKAGAATVDSSNLQTQAQETARQNAANSAALEAQYNPGAAELRANSLNALNTRLGSTNPQLDAIAAQVAAQAGSAPVGVSYNSPLLQQAIDRASQDLTLGGALPQDVRNLVARQALARSASTTGGGLGLGRDITARDLGLTSLQLAQQRLQNAASIGGQQSSQGLANAGYDLQSQLAGTNNLFNSANFLQSLDSGEFSKALAAANLGQNIAPPNSGLSPDAMANLAVGNANAQAQYNAQQQAINAQNAKDQMALGGQLLGAGVNLASKYFNQPKAPSTTSPTSYTPSVVYTPSTATTNASWTSGGYVPPSVSTSSYLPSSFGGF